MSDDLTCSYAEATALTPLPVDPQSMPKGEGVLAQQRFGVDLRAEWGIAGKLNGGYLTALLAQAAIQSGTVDHAVALSASFLTAPNPGPAEVHTEMVRDGRTLDQLRSRIVQNGQVCVEALVTLGSVLEVSEPQWDAGVGPAPVLHEDTLIQVPPRGPSGDTIAMYEQVDVYLDAAVVGFAMGKPSGKGEMRGRIHPVEGGRFDSASMIMALDAFPPSAFEIGSTGWVPTICYTTYIRALPAPGPLTVSVRAQLAEGNRVDEIATAWDSRGVVVAQATQLSGVRFS